MTTALLFLVILLAIAGDAVVVRRPTQQRRLPAALSQHRNTTKSFCSCYGDWGCDYFDDCCDGIKTGHYSLFLVLFSALPCGITCRGLFL